MRTTLTLDDDVAAELERLRRDRGTDFKTLVNDLLRGGLRELANPAKRRKPFRTRSVDLGPPRIRNLDNTAEVLAAIEGEWYR